MSLLLRGPAVLFTVIEPLVGNTTSGTSEIVGVVPPVLVMLVLPETLCTAVAAAGAEMLILLLRPLGVRTIPAPANRLVLTLVWLPTTVVLIPEPFPADATD